VVERGPGIGTRSSQLSQDHNTDTLGDDKTLRAFVVPLAARPGTGSSAGAAVDADQRLMPTTRIDDAPFDDGQTWSRKETALRNGESAMPRRPCFQSDR
jgi:hypothetical protein